MKVDIAARRRRIYQVAEGFARLKWILRGMNEFYEVLPICFFSGIPRKESIETCFGFQSKCKKNPVKITGLSCVLPSFYKIY